MPVKTIKALLPIIKEVQAAFFIYKKAEDKEPFNFGSLISPKECIGKCAIEGPMFYFALIVFLTALIVGPV
jgi:hypothetical protein